MQNRFAKKVDRSQPGIVNGLRDAKVQVVITNMGDNFPDLLCSTGGEWILLEVKERDGCASRGQLEFLRDAEGPVAIVTNLTEALCAVWHGDGIILNGEQELIAAWLIRNPNQETLSTMKLLKLIGREISNASSGTQR